VASVAASVIVLLPLCQGITKGAPHDQTDPEAERDQIEEFALEKDQITIGRAKESDIVIDNIAVSRRHAEITGRKEICTSSGTWAAPTVPSQRAQIDVHDTPFPTGVIGIAKFELQVKALSKAAAPSAKAAAPEDAEGTMIFDPARRKPAAEPQAARSPSPSVGRSSPRSKAPAKGRNIRSPKK